MLVSRRPRLVVPVPAMAPADDRALSVSGRVIHMLKYYWVANYIRGKAVQQLLNRRGARAGAIWRGARVKGWKSLSHAHQAPKASASPRAVNRALPFPAQGTDIHDHEFRTDLAQADLTGIGDELHSREVLGRNERRRTPTS